MTPVAFRTAVLLPGLETFRQISGMQTTKPGEVLLMAIAGQESAWQQRRQIGGPARGYWQFEKGGGIRGVMTHSASKPHLVKMCDALDIPFDEAVLYEAIAWSDTLAVAMARLLLWTDPAKLPEIGEPDAAWRMYMANWRPGKPHPATWPDRYRTAMG